MSFLTNLHRVFYSGCASLHSHQQCARVPFPTSSPTLVICGLFNDSHSDRCEVIYLMVILIFISLMISYVEHIFFLMCLLAICIFFLEKWLFSSSAPIWSCLFLMLSCMNCLYMLAINILSVMSFAEMFSHSYRLYFSFHWWLALLCKIF